jgi:hypothetical protein
MLTNLNLLFLSPDAKKNYGLKKIKVQHDSRVFKIGHLKCPFFKFWRRSWEKLSRFYIYY